MPMTFAAAVSVRDPVSLILFIIESADFMASSRLAPLRPVDKAICFMDLPMLANSFADIPSCVCQLMNMSFVASVDIPREDAALSADVVTDF